MNGNSAWASPALQGWQSSGAGLPGCVTRPGALQALQPGTNPQEASRAPSRPALQTVRLREPAGSECTLLCSRKSGQYSDGRAQRPEREALIQHMDRKLLAPLHVLADFPGDPHVPGSTRSSPSWHGTSQFSVELALSSPPCFGVRKKSYQWPPSGSWSHKVLSTTSVPKGDTMHSCSGAGQRHRCPRRPEGAFSVMLTTHLFLLGITPICSLSPCGVTSLACHHSSSEALMTCRMSP